MPDQELPGSGRLDPQRSRVWLQLLGEPKAFLDGQPVKVASKSLGLLAYLMLEGKTQRREIAVQLWPDSEDVLNNLSVAGAGLRRALGQDILLLETDMVQLSPVVTCDLIEYQSLANAEPEDWARALEHWQPFMLEYRLSDWAQGQGVEFEDWLEETREAVGGEREALALKLFTHHVRHQRFEAAGARLETHLQSVLAVREDVARWGMLVLGVLGQTSKIDMIYARLVRGLRSELEVEPTSITREAFEVARKGQTQECQRRLETELPPEQDLVPAAKPAPRPGPHEAQFVGRRAELRSIRERFAQLGTGSAFIFLNGEPGAGKTRLALEASEMIGREQPKAPALFAATAATGLLLNSFERLLDGLIAAPKPGSSPKLEPLSGVQRDALARLLSDPARHGLETPITSALSPELERRNLFDAARALLNQTGLEQHQPVLLVIDDLQWSDQASLDLIEYLLANPPEHGLCIIGIARNTETPSANLNALLTRITRQQDALRLPIGALEEADCASLAAHFGREIDPNGLLRATGGNPLYLVELLRASPGTSARRVQDLLRSRLETTPELERQTLEALAVLGNAVGLPAIRQTAGRSLDESLTALEGLRTAALVIEDATGFRFHHDLTRELVLEDLFPARAGLLNLRAAKARADTPILAANHYWAAKDLLEQDDATQAGQAFLHVASVHAVGNDLEVGLQWFDRAFEMARDLRLKIRILTTKVRMLMMYWRYDQVDEGLTLAESLDDGHDPLTTARLLNARASYVIIRASEVEKTIDLSIRALKLLELSFSQDDFIEKAEAYNNLGIAYYTLYNFETAQFNLEKSLEIRRKIGNISKIGESLQALGLLFAKQGLSNAESILSEEILIWKNVKNVQNLAYSYNHLGIYWLNVKKYRKAEGYFKKAIEFDNKNSTIDFLLSICNNLGAIYFITGNLKKSKEFYCKALGYAYKENNLFKISTVLGNLVEVSIYVGDLEDANLNISKGREILQNTPYFANLSDFAWYEAEVCVLEGELKNAESFFLESYSLAIKAQHARRAARANARLARLTVNIDLATSAFELFESPVTYSSLQAVTGDVLAAIETIKSLDEPYEEFRLLLDLGYMTGKGHFMRMAQKMSEGFRAL